MKNLFKGLSKDTFLLTFASFFSDVSTEMLYPVLPVFLSDILSAPAAAIGIVEGFATAAQYTVQGLSGWISDHLKKRKTIALIGTFIAAVAKFSIGLSANWVQVIISRSIERLSTGVRASPRDALVADSATEGNRGKAFGLEGIGDNLGAFVGPLIAILLLYGLHQHIRSIFYFAFIPVLLAVLMISFVREKKHERVAPSEKTTVKLSSIKSFPKSYWKYLLVTAIFGLGNSSNAFLILRTKQIGISLELTIVIYAFFNLVAALSSYPAGTLSDKFGRKNILLLAFLIFIVVYLGFAVNSSFMLIGFLFVLYGVFSGIYRAVGKAFATDFAGPQLRASAVGFYSTIIGLTSLVASIVAGVLWTNLNPSATFIYGAIFALLGTVALLILVRNSNA